MAISERRSDRRSDRRRVPRGGRRADDQPGRYPNLLVADSYDGARDPVARYLDRFGFRVEQCADGEVCLAAIEARPPHVILIEDELPKVAAPLIVRRLKEQDRTKGIPVIVMTADFDGRDKQAAETESAAVLVKPFALSTMLQEIRRVLREHSPLTIEQRFSQT
jgi:two-component system, OmpR family, phosphate regulon response regulator PhoB